MIKQQMRDANEMKYLSLVMVWAWRRSLTCSQYDDELLSKVCWFN